MWGHLPSEDRKYRLFENFCRLVHATKIATKRSVTTAKAQEFQDVMITYLRGLNELFPTHQLVPSHHVALHMKELLCRLGPTHAWRCWVFERYNHILQKVPTNGNFGESRRSLVLRHSQYSPGQLEITLFERLCMNQRLRGIVSALRLDGCLQKLTNAFSQHFESMEKGTLMSDLHAFRSTPEPGVYQQSNTPEKLDRHTSELLEAYEKQIAEQAIGSCPEVTIAQTRQRGIRLCIKHKKFGRGGVKFSPHNHLKQDSYIAVKGDLSDNWHSACIQEILTYTHRGPTPEMDGHTETYFVVKRFRELTEADASYDPYRKHQFVAGRLYYDAFEEDLELVPSSSVLCHLACTPFENTLIESKCVHTLPLDRVGLHMQWSITQLT
jgi:hypothetical protein